MRIVQHIDDLLSDLEDFEPDSLSHLVRFVRDHSEYSAITMLARNLDRSSQRLHDQCEFLQKGVVSRPDAETADIQFAALLLIVSDVVSTSTTNRFDKLLSSASEESGEYYWSRGMATSYLLHKEVTNEKIRQSA
jgi:hypothetical protein